MVNCISDMTHPDEKRGPSQAYFGTYQPSKDTFFYTFNKSSDHTLTGSVVIGLIVLDTNYTSASNQALIQIVAFDSGKSQLKEFYNLNFNIKYSFINSINKFRL